MPKRIAIVGKMHSGKTTVARFLQDRGFERVAFADPVKHVSAQMLNVFVHAVDPDQDPQYDIDIINDIKGHPSIRKFLQLVGTELGREWYGPESIWIDMFERVVSPTTFDVINDDCRFPNEADRLKNMGFTLVKLIRDEDERVDSVRRAVARDNPDLSEYEVIAKLHDMLNHPSEVNVDLIYPDINVHSVSVRQLEQIAEELVTLEPSEFIRLNDARNNQIGTLFPKREVHEYAGV